MINILHLMPTSGPGGAEKLLIEIVSSLNKERYHSVVGMLNTGWLTKKLEEIGVDIKVLRSGGSIDYVLLNDLVKIIRLQDIDIIHSHLLDMNLYAVLSSKLTNTPLICTEHGDIHHISKRSWKNIVKARTISALADMIVFVSQYTENYFQEYVKKSPNLRAVIYNGIDENIFEKADAEQKKVLRKKLHLNESALLIANVGNLYPVKGQKFLIQAFRIIKDSVSNSELLLIGRGELERELKTEAEKLGIMDSVRFLGFREDVSDILKAIDIFVLSSLSEGLPIALIEAMSCGLSVVATDVGGVREVIQDGIDGFIVPPEDPFSLAERINLIIDNSSTMSTICENATKKVKSLFSKSVMIRRYEELYDYLLSKRNSA